MQYMGGKARIARRIVAAILADTNARTTWFEPFVGGGNVMEHAAAHFVTAVGADCHPDLIMMWEHVTAGGMIPDLITRDEYQALRGAPPSWLRGFAGFGASFGGKWFGGYGVSPRDGEVCRQSFRTVNRQAGVFTANRVRFTCARFGAITPPHDAVVYCDPPYANTTGYSTGTFDYPTFYSTLTTWAETRSVYLSEYAVPAGINSRVIWSHEKSMPLDRASNIRTAKENLYRILPAG